MGRESRVNAARRSAEAAAAKAVPVERRIKLRDADYWHLKSALTSAAAAQQTLQQAGVAFQRAQAEQNVLMAAMAKKYKFKPEGTRIGLDDKSRTIAIVKVGPPQEASAQG